MRHRSLRLPGSSGEYLDILALDGLDHADWHRGFGFGAGLQALEDEVYPRNLDPHAAYGGLQSVEHDALADCLAVLENDGLQQQLRRVLGESLLALPADYPDRWLYHELDPIFVLRAKGASAEFGHKHAETF